MTRWRLTWLLLGVVGWAAVVWLAIGLGGGGAASAGFDLDLLLEGGRRVAAGESPYDPRMIEGDIVVATTLFYSYPPPVAQAMSLVAGWPIGLVLVIWDLGAVIGLVAVAEGLRRRYAADADAIDVGVAVAGGAPYVFPFTIGLLFGNADVYFPTLYGLMLLAATGASRAGAAAGGFAVAVASLKLHPMSMALWFFWRGLRDRGSGSAPLAWIVLWVALITVVSMLILSVVLWGTGPWLDFAAVVRGGSRAAIVDPRNAGPAALVAGMTGGTDMLARTMHIPVAVTALLVTSWVAWRWRDPVASLGVATVASFVILPVTWYHYPSALIPFAIAAILRSRGWPEARATVPLLAIATALAAVAIAWLPLLWVAIALALVAVVSSAPADAEALSTTAPSRTLDGA